MKKLMIFAVFLMLMIFVVGCAPKSAIIPPKTPAPGAPASELPEGDDYILELDLELDDEFGDLENFETEDFEYFEDLGDSFTI